MSDWPAKEAAAAAEVAVGPAARWWWWWWWSLCSRDACLLAAAIGQPDKLRWVLRLVLTWPRPLQPGVGHFRIVSCIARTNGHGQQNHPISFDLSINDLYLYIKDLQCILIGNYSFFHCYTLLALYMFTSVRRLLINNRNANTEKEKEIKERVESK